MNSFISNTAKLQSLHIARRKLARPLITIIVSSWIQSFAASPENIALECERQMLSGICFTRSSANNATSSSTIILSGAGRVSYSAYLDYVGKYDDKNPTDTSMCKTALYYMKYKPGSDHDKIARAMWTPLIIPSKK